MLGVDTIQSTLYGLEAGAMCMIGTDEGTEAGNGRILKGSVRAASVAASCMLAAGRHRATPT